MSLPFRRKRFGQHFLIDRAIIDLIVELIDPRPTDHLVEIGPGRGALTASMVKKGMFLSVIEIDRDLAAIVSKEFGHHPNFKLHVEDALKIDYSMVARSKSIRVIGNLPYNISTPLVLKLADQGGLIEDMIFMLQKEVVDRLAARPGTKDYGRLSVMVQSQGQVEPSFEVPPTAFAPPPKVTSKLVRITPQLQTLSTAGRSHLESSVRIAFGQRRKTIKNTLGKVVPHDVLEACDIGLMQRPEEIEVAAYVRLAQLMCEA